ncbi:VOC family protein [Actinotalea sp. Marseille-Q4924]|uniref:VOC family protein n=1 Tax=Actinotalea sp. Marseille-Q4924 TaxID=2866571 RepID=UPI001CE45C1E|nr:VOC family protein [Actinotalea sp. Marseille-Q4924]
MSATEPTFQLRATVLGARDPERLGRFWAELLGWELFVDDETWCRVRPASGQPGLSVQREELHVPPAWPAGDGEQQMQMHLDVQVDDVDAAVRRALELGATLEDHQPQEDNRVLRDPEGHLFCLFLT